MQNTFSQSGNDFKWFSKKSFFRIGMWNSRPPPPFMEKKLLNFHFDYLIIRLRDPRKRKIWASLNFSACIFLSPFFANFCYVRWLILFARCRTQQSPPVVNVMDPRKWKIWTSLSFTACILFVTLFRFFFCKNCSRSRRKGSKNTFLKINYSCQFNLDFYHPWEFYCSFNLKK